MILLRVGSVCCWQSYSYQQQAHAAARVHQRGTGRIHGQGVTGQCVLDLMVFTVACIGVQCCCQPSAVNIANPNLLHALLVHLPTAGQDLHHTARRLLMVAVVN
jgi:hypothetical protein